VKAAFQNEPLAPFWSDAHIVNEYQWVNVMSISGFFGAALLGAALFASPAMAATLHEADGSFSSDWRAPTPIPEGTTGVAGSGAPDWMGGDRFDIFHFSVMGLGATPIDFDFWLTDLDKSGGYRNGGGAIYYSFVPFSGRYYVDEGGGQVLGSENLLAGYFEVTFNPWQEASATNRGASSFTLNLGEAFRGDLFLALDFTHGRVSYSISASAWTSPSESAATPAPVPLPAAGWLMLAALSALGFVAAGLRKVISRSTRKRPG